MTNAPRPLLEAVIPAHVRGSQCLAVPGEVLSVCPSLTGSPVMRISSGLMLVQ